MVTGSGREDPILKTSAKKMSAMQREAALMMQQSFTMMSQPVNENSDPSSLKTTKNHYECDRIMSPLPNRLGSK